MKILILFLILLNLSFSMTSGEYWEALNKKADEIYGGLDLTLTINVGNYYNNSDLISSLKKNRTINLVFLKERHIDTEAYERALEQVVNITLWG